MNARKCLKRSLVVMAGGAIFCAGLYAGVRLGNVELRNALVQMTQWLNTEPKTGDRIQLTKDVWALYKLPYGYGFQTVTVNSKLRKEEWFMRLLDQNKHFVDNL